MSYRPGPWSIGRSGENVLADRYVICIVVNHGEAERDANARLIAAAPELLDALKGLCKRFHSCVLNSGSDDEFADLAIQEYDLLIAKVEGRS